MNNTEQALTILVAVLIGVQLLNFVGDKMFRDDQIQINGNFIQMHNNTSIMTEALGIVVLDLNEKVTIILDELFDRVWEDLEQT